MTRYFIKDLCMLISDVSCPYEIFNARTVSTIYFIASDLKILEYFNFSLAKLFLCNFKMHK